MWRCLAAPRHLWTFSMPFGVCQHLFVFAQVTLLLKSSRVSGHTFHLLYGRFFYAWLGFHPVFTRFSRLVEATGLEPARSPPQTEWPTIGLCLYRKGGCPSLQPDFRRGNCFRRLNGRNLTSGGFRRKIRFAGEVFCSPFDAIQERFQSRFLPCSHINSLSRVSDS